MARGMATEDVLAALRSVELFARLDEAVLAQLAAVVRPRSFDRGQLVFVEGDPGDSLLVLVSGSVTVFRTACCGGSSSRDIWRTPGSPRRTNWWAILPTDPPRASVSSSAPSTG